MIFNWIQRFRHSRGYGVHSPFAFDFITNVVYEKHWYYAFTDFEYLLLNNGIDIHNFGFHHLSYRLIRHFKPSTLLEIGLNDAVNTMFVCHPHKDLVCYSLGKDESTVDLTKKLLSEINRETIFVDHIDNTIAFDSIFVHTDDINIEELIALSGKDAFWVIKGVDSSEGRKVWKSVVRDKRVSVTFDKKDVGIVLLNKSYKKQNYLI